MNRATARASAEPEAAEAAVEPEVPELAPPNSLIAHALDIGADLATFFGDEIAALFGFEGPGDVAAADGDKAPAAGDGIAAAGGEAATTAVGDAAAPRGGDVSAGGDAAAASGEAVATTGDDTAATADDTTTPADDAMTAGDTATAAGGEAGAASGDVAAPAAPGAAAEGSAPGSADDIRARVAGQLARLPHPTAPSADAAAAPLDAVRERIQLRGETRAAAARPRPARLTGDAPRHRRPPRPDPGPIPAEMEAVRAKTGRTLSPVALPAPEPSPRGTVPNLAGPILTETELQAVRLGERGIVTFTRGDDEASVNEAAKLREVLRGLGGTTAATPAPAGPAPEAQASVPGVAIVDQPIAGVELTPQQRAVFGEVAVRLLADADSEARLVLRAIRTAHSGYPGGALERAFVAPIGEDLLPELSDKVANEAHGLADALQLVPEQVSMAVDMRRSELRERAAAALHTLTLGAFQANTAATAADARTQATADATAATTRRGVAADRVRERPVSAAEARAREAVRQLGEPIATELARYDMQLGSRRRGIADAVRIQTAAIRLARIRDERALDPPPGQQATHEQMLQAGAVGRWADGAITALDQAQAALNTAAETETNQFKSELEAAATAAFDALHAWGANQRQATEAWWTELDGRLQQWATNADARVDLWRTQQAEQSRLALAQDLAAVQHLVELQQAGNEAAVSAYLQGLEGGTRAVVAGLGGGGDLVSALEAGVRERVRARLQTDVETRLDQELDGLDLSVAANWDGLDRLVKATVPDWNVADRVEKIHGSVTSWTGFKEEAIFQALSGLTPLAGRMLRYFYQQTYDQSLDDALHGYGHVGHLSEDERDTANQLLRGDRVLGAIGAIHSALAGAGAEIGAVNTILRGLSDEERTRAIAGYAARYGESLEAMLNSQWSLSGSEVRETMALANNDPRGASAIALARSVQTIHMDSGPVAVINREAASGVFAQIRTEVEAEGRRRHWVTAQIEAEIAVRNAEVERRFNIDQRDVWWAQGAPQGASAMRTAFALARGPGEDLLEGMADNDMTRVDVARLRLEDLGVYAEDAAINAVFRDQASRSLAESERDLGPLLSARLERRMAAEDEQESRTEEQRVNRRMELERENARELTADADARTRERFDRLGVEYRHASGRSLARMVEANMSGASRREARARVGGHGVLSPYQRIRYSIEGLGTDVPMLRSTLATMSREEIRQANRDWKRDHPGETIYEAIADDTSGREQGDLLDMARYGAPQTAEDLVRAAERRYARDRRQETGIGASLSSQELELARREVGGLRARLTAMRTARGGSDAGWRASESFDIAIERANTAIDMQRRAVDSAADLLANAAAIVTAVVVGVLLSPFTGGGSAVVAAAVISSIAATAVSMGVKALVKGGAYGHEEIFTDLAVGAVDALVAALTAGLGNALLGRVASRGVTPVTKSTLYRGLMRLGSVGRAAAAGQAGVARNLGRMGTSGLLARGVERYALLGGMAQSKRLVTRLVAHGTAELIEQTVQAVPSSLAASLLDESVYRQPGGPMRVLHNTLDSTVHSVGMGLGMSGVHHGVGATVGLGIRGVRSVAEHVRAMAPPEIRLPTGDVLAHMGTARERLADFHAWGADHPGGTAREFNAMRRSEAIQRWEVTGKHAQRVREAREHLLGDLKPEERGRYADVPIRSVSDAEFARLSRKPGADAHLLVHEGQAIVLLRDGAPASAASSVLPAVKERVFAGSGGATVESALPPHLRDTEVRVDHKLTGDEVRVVPHPPGDGPITHVEVVIGPDAKPIDVALHAHEVARMRRWTGRLGEARMTLARYAERVGLRLDTPADRTRFEAAGELGKLEPIIDERVRRYAEATDPGAASQLESEVYHLIAQQERARRILSGELVAEARGFVAAEGTPKVKPHEEAAPHTDDTTAAKTTARAQELARTLIDHEASRERVRRQAIDEVYEILRRRGEVGSVDGARRLFMQDPATLDRLATRLDGEVAQLRDSKLAARRDRVQLERARIEALRSSAAHFDAAITQTRADMSALGLPALHAELNTRLTYERLHEGLALICFPPDTPVAVPGGTVAIGGLQPGDAVLSADPETGETRVDRVTRRIDAWTDWLVEIAVGGETVRATRSHRFAVAGGEWLPARLLTPGTRLVSLDRREWVVDRVSLVRNDTPTCNLEVEANHCYFAGGVLVHNGEPTRSYTNEKVWKAEIYYLRKNGVIVYIGSTREQGLTLGRFDGHLADGRTGKMPYKRDWYDQYHAGNGGKLEGDTLTFGEYTLTVEHRGEYTDLALAIVEQAHIFSHGEHLLNKAPALGEDAFNKYFTEARGLNERPCR